MTDQNRETRLRTATWTLADQGVVSLGNFLLNIQLARALPSSEYGVFALLFSVIFLYQHCSVALLVYPMSLRVAASLPVRDTALISATAALMAAGTLAFGVVLLIALALMGRADLGIAVAAFCVVWQVQDSFRRSLMTELRHREAMIGDGITYLGPALAVSYLSAKGILTLPLVLLSMTVSSAIGGAIQLRQLALPMPRLGGAATLLQEFWQSGKWAIVSGLLLHMRLQILPWTLSLVHGTSATAAFQAAINVANLTNPVLFGLSNTIAASTARARTSGSSRDAWLRVRYYMMLGAPFIVLYSLAVFAMPDRVLLLFYGAGSGYLEHTAAVRFIIAAIVLGYFADTIGAFLYGLDKGKTLTQLSVAAIVAGAVSALLALPWAVTGAAAAYFLVNVARLLTSLIAMRNELAASEPARSAHAEAPGSDAR